MPIYSYKCVECGHAKDEYMRMSSIPVLPCPACGKDTYEKQVVRPHSDLVEFATSIEMQSIGCNSMDEIRQMQAAGVECSDDPRSELFGVPIARNRKEKLKALRVAGFQESN